jgi:CheY-like chemotaxis protein
LGLAICNELSSLMGGSLTLESKLGEGSTFYVRLPLPVAQERATLAASRLREWDGRTLNVLLVEGDTTATTAIAGMLEHQGHCVRSAANGLNALAELAQELSFDVILLDVDLPGIDGFQVAQLIRQSEPSGQYTPIIAMTTRTRAEEVTRGHEVGVDGFLRKPLTSAQLSTEMTAVLTARKTRSETHTV